MVVNQPDHCVANRSTLVIPPPAEPLPDVPCTLSEARDVEVSSLSVLDDDEVRPLAIVLHSSEDAYEPALPRIKPLPALDR